MHTVFKSGFRPSRCAVTDQLLLLLGTGYSDHNDFVLIPENQYVSMN